MRFIFTHSQSLVIEVYSLFLLLVSMTSNVESKAHSVIDDSSDFEPYDSNSYHPILSAHLDRNPHEELNSITSENAGQPVLEETEEISQTVTPIIKDQVQIDSIPSLDSVKEQTKKLETLIKATTEAPVVFREILANTTASTSDKKTTITNELSEGTNQPETTTLSSIEKEEPLKQKEKPDQYRFSQPHLLTTTVEKVEEQVETVSTPLQELVIEGTKEQVAIDPIEPSGAFTSKNEASESIAAPLDKKSASEIVTNEAGLNLTETTSSSLEPKEEPLKQPKAPVARKEISDNLTTPDHITVPEVIADKVGIDLTETLSSFPKPEEESLKQPKLYDSKPTRTVTLAFDKEEEQVNTVTEPSLDTSKEGVKNLDLGDYVNTGAPAAHREISDNLTTPDQTTAPEVIADKVGMDLTETSSSFPKPEEESLKQQKTYDSKPTQTVSPLFKKEKEQVNAVTEPSLDTSKEGVKNLDLGDYVNTGAPAARKEISDNLSVIKKDEQVEVPMNRGTQLNQLRKERDQREELKKLDITQGTESVTSTIVEEVLASTMDKSVVLYTLFCILCVAFFKFVKWAREPKFERPTIQPPKPDIGPLKKQLSDFKRRHNIQSNLQCEVSRLNSLNTRLQQRLQLQKRLAPLKESIKGRENIQTKLFELKNYYQILHKINLLLQRRSELSNKLLFSRYESLMMITNFVKLEHLLDLMKHIKFNQVKNSLEDSTLELKVENDFLGEEINLFRKLALQFREDYDNLNNEILQEKKIECKNEEEFAKLKKLCDELDLDNSIDTLKRKIADKEKETDTHYKDYINNYYWLIGKMS